MKKGNKIKGEKGGNSLYVKSKNQWKKLYSFLYHAQNENKRFYSGYGTWDRDQDQDPSKQ